MTPVFPGCLSAFPAHSQTFKPTPASFTQTQIGNHNIQRVRNLSVLFFSYIEIQGSLSYHIITACQCRGGGASKQLGGARRTCKHATLGGSGGMLPQENFHICKLWDWIWSHLLGIWNQVLTSVKLSNLLVLEQLTRGRVRRCVRRWVRRCVRLQR